MKRLLSIAFLLICVPVFASTLTIPITYQTNGTVTASNLNGNFNSITSVINGGLDNTNVNTASGYRLFEVLSALPSAGTQGRTVFLTTNNTLNLDNGSAYNQLFSLPSGAVSGNVAFYNGAAWTTKTIMPAGGTTGQVLSKSSASDYDSGWTTISYPYIKLTNTQSSSVDGGTTTSGSWQTATLNTKDIDSASIATLAGNAVSLPAGTYNVKGVMPFYVTGAGYGYKCRLYNNTGSAVLLNGQSTGAGPNGTQIYSNIIGQFTLSVTSSVIFQYYVTVGQASSGQGYAQTFDTNVYTILELIKVQ